MGVFDEVLNKHAFFGQHKGEICQTKSLHPYIGGALQKYEITPAGRLEFLDYRIDDRSDPKAEGGLRLAGFMAMVLTGGRRDLNCHGWLEVEGIGRAKFTEVLSWGLTLGRREWTLFNEATALIRRQVSASRIPKV